MPIDEAVDDSSKRAVMADPMLAVLSGKLSALRLPPARFLLSALVAMGLLSLITIPLSGHLSDRIGRKRMYIIGAVATAIYGFIYFGMLNSLVRSADIGFSGGLTQLSLLAASGNDFGGVKA